MKMSFVSCFHDSNDHPSLYFLFPLVLLGTRSSQFWYFPGTPTDRITIPPTHHPSIHPSIQPQIYTIGTISTTIYTIMTIARSVTAKPIVPPIAIDTHKTVLTGDVVKLATVERELTKGRNVSGRTWKVRPQKRASTLIKTTTNNSVKTWETRKIEKVYKQEARELQTDLREQRRMEKVTKRERKLENEKRRAENEFKSSQKSAQTLNYNKVGSTMKAMSKKQLRQIKKTRMNTKTGVIEYVSAFAK